MSAVLLVFVIALINLMLGLYLGIQLGYGPPDLATTSRMLFDGTGKSGLDTFQTPGSSSFEDEESEEAESWSIESLTEEDDELSDEASESSGESIENDDQESVDSGDMEDWTPDEKPIETSVLELNVALIKSGKRSAEIDSQLRESQDEVNVETTRKCCEALKETCEVFLQEQATSAEKLEAHLKDLGEMAELRKEIEETNQAQTTQIQNTLEAIGNIDFESDPKKINEQLLEELQKLRVQRHHFLDFQNEAFLSISRQEGPLEEFDKSLLQDPLTQIDNRIGLETKLYETFQNGEHKNQGMSFALLDFNDFGKVNRKYGPDVGDLILQKWSDFLKQHKQDETFIARFTGQQFLIQLLDTGGRNAIKQVEFLRQSLEKMTFEHAKGEINLTLTGAIVEVQEDDEEAELLSRLRKTLALAKKEGANRIIFDDGQEIELVKAPNLGAKHQTIQLETAS